MHQMTYIRRINGYQLRDTRYRIPVGVKRRSRLIARKISMKMIENLEINSGGTQAKVKGV